MSADESARVRDLGIRVLPFVRELASEIPGGSVGLRYFGRFLATSGAWMNTHGRVRDTDKAVPDPSSPGITMGLDLMDPTTGWVIVALLAGTFPHVIVRSRLQPRRPDEPTQGLCSVEVFGSQSFSPPIGGPATDRTVGLAAARALMEIAGQGATADP